MKVTLYSTGCPKCKILTQKLNDKNVKYDVVNDVDIMLSKGFETVPMLEVDGNVMDFMSANKWINEREGD
jgi:glutaredoxin